MVDLNTLIVISVNVVGVAAVVLTNKNDTKWVIKNFDEHRLEDKQAFDSIKQDVRELRERMNGRGGRS